MDKDLNVVILAAGKGTRMASTKPKVLHGLAGRSLLQHTLDTAKELKSTSIQVVIGHQADQIKQSINDQKINFVEQSEQLGTGHAVHQSLPYLDESAIALILYGDVPLIKAETLKQLLKLVNENSMAVLTCDVTIPKGLGRILRNADGKIEGIIEEKDANTQQRQITEINTGIMAVPVKKLGLWLPRINSHNAQKEYYLTDLVALAIEDGSEVFSFSCENIEEVSGINDRLQLATLERHYQQEKAKQLLLSGVSLADPNRIDIRGEVEIAKDVEIDINVVLEGSVKIGQNCKVGANCILKDCVIGEGTNILPNTMIDESIIGSNCNIGPFARLRPGTMLANKVKIGNFVETKKTLVKEGSKINHLSYVGDSELGSNVNVGAGTITCNYDGKNKFKTIVGNDVFIGSNSSIVAPVILADGATVGAGSTITKDVEENELAVARQKQNNIQGWNRPKKV